jgi:hypothetical protein
MQGTSDKIRKQLPRYNIRTVHIPAKQNMHSFRSVKDALGLKVPSMYSIPCECVQVYTGQTHQSTEMTCKEHTRHICLYHLDKLVVAEHIINEGHCINCKDTMLSAKMAGYMGRLSKEPLISSYILTTSTETQDLLQSILEPSHKHTLTKYGQQAIIEGRVNSSQQSSMSRLSSTECVRTGLTDRLTTLTIPIG